ncbi:MAG: hypothetical protein Kow0059_01400 [Candidatus Sumerlaeia bacterium]
MSDELVRRSSIEKWNRLDKLVPDIMSSWRKFYKSVMEPGHLDPKTKELIMIAVMHAKGCPWCIDTHVRKARRLGATAEEIAEAAATAALIMSGSTLMHHIVAAEAQDWMAENEPAK